MPDQKMCLFVADDADSLTKQIGAFRFWAETDGYTVEKLLTRFEGDGEIDFHWCPATDNVTSLQSDCKQKHRALIVLEKAPPEED